jgi:hypothetical protein
MLLYTGDSQRKECVLGAFTTAFALRPEVMNVPNLGEADKVGNVLTIATPRYPAYAHFWHVGLFYAAPGVI